VKDEYGVGLITEEQLKADDDFDAIILAVAHDSFKELDIKSMKGDKTIVYDVKGILPPDIVDERL